MIYSAAIDECESNPCQNSGTCTDRVNGFVCNCRVGFHGSRCETGNANFTSVELYYSTDVQFRATNEDVCVCIEIEANTN